MKIRISRESFLFLFFVVVGTCPILGQERLFGEKEPVRENKLPYDHSLDSLWSSDTYLHELSPDGKWVAFSENFPIKEDVLYLAHTSGSKLLSFTGTSNIVFSPDSKWFASKARNGELTLVNLSEGSKERLSNILDFAFSFDGRFFAYIQTKQEGRSKLEVKDFQSKANYQLDHAVKFAWNPKKNMLLAVVKEKDSLTIAKFDALSDKSKPIFTSDGTNLSYLKWNATGTMALMAEATNEEHRLYTYNVNGRVRKLTDDIIEDYDSNYRISPWEPYVTDDGEKILFYRQQKDSLKTKPTHTAEVWDTADPWIYPRMEFYDMIVQSQLLTAWYPQTGVLREVETEKMPSSAMNVNHDNALVFDLKQYEPLYKYEPNADLYLKEIETGKKTLVAKNQYTEQSFVSISPAQKYIAYFKNGDWWIFQIETGKTVNLTQNIEFKFQDNDQNYAGDPAPYGIPKWFPNDEYIVLYDKYDIWLVNPDGDIKKRITDGRKKNIRYRINKSFNGNRSLSIGMHKYASNALKPQNGFVLTMFDFDTYKSGYALWNKNKNIETIIFGEQGSDGLLGTKNLDELVYRKQGFNAPTSIYGYNRKTNKEKLLHQSNKKLLTYDLGRAELLEYTLKNGKKAKAALLYPAEYDPSKKYPMIVHIYERESRRINQFDPPSNYNGEGFNPLLYTTNGYFVLYPDFSYIIGDPGISALKGAIAAVNKVLKMGKVDESKLGLIGHSFGGYETAFIVTQTNMFAAAVAGAPVTDLISEYHSIFWDMNYTQLWRMENQQFRMGNSFYNKREAYYRNSPLQHVEKINTPLFLWAGKKDSNVNWTQSVHMFIALKRLHKKANMLLFENEAHGIVTKVNQEKLSTSIFKWMEQYLKN